MSDDRVTTPSGYSTPNPDTIARDQIHSHIQGSLQRLEVLQNNKTIPYSLIDLEVIRAEANLLKKLTKRLYDEGVTPFPEALGGINEEQSRE